jgi:lipid-binding SYLF domain-containing protein
MRHHTIVALLVLILMLGLPSPGIPASDELDAQALVDKSAAVAKRFAADKDFTIFQEHVKKAKALLIIPRVLKAGFFWGGSGGDGVLVVRDEKTGAWSQPAFYTIGSVSFGLQVGAQEAEVIMLAMSQKAIDTLYSSSFKFGGDLSVAAGQEGVGAKRIITADFISFAKAKGLYAGLDLEGSGVHVRDDLNKAYYGKTVRPVEIIVQKTVSNPRSADLHAVLEKSFGPR